VPVLVFLFTNLMNSAAPRRLGLSSATSSSLSLMGKLLFGTFVISVPAILIWSYTRAPGPKLR
jgi:POT family proton-dependent oligopeptide transporter